MQPQPDRLPLDGLRVIEFAHMVMGPTCGLVLADLGAEVIKIEPVPYGDNTRRLSGSGAGFFAAFNRNKRSISVDVKSPQGKEIVLRLIDTADALTENFRPGAMDALGLGYEALARRNPRLVYCSLKGFLDGPYENRTALDEVVQMMGGLAYMTGPPGRPLRAGTSINDIGGGMFGAIAILAALRERERTGAGQHVKSGLFENNAFLVAQHIAQYAVTGQPARPMPVRLAAWGVYDVFETADGGQLFVAVVTDGLWKAFCEAFDLRDLLADPALATNPQRVQARERVIPRVAERFKAIAKAELAATCERIGLPFAPINRPEDLLADPHLAAGGLLDVALPQGGSARLPALPISFDGRRPGVRLGLPRAGEHGRQLLAELGYANDEIERLIETGAVAAPDSMQA